MNKSNFKRKKMGMTGKKSQKAVLELPDGTSFHLFLDEDERKLKIRCTAEVGSAALSVEPIADNAIAVALRS